MTPNQLIEAHLGLAETIAAQHHRWAVGGYDRDDLRAAAHVGLCEAARTWDPDRGTPFEAWAWLRIRAAIIDDLRAWAGVSVRAARRRGEDIERPASLDAAGDDGATLGASVPAYGPEVAATALLRVAVAAGARACRDDLDRAVLAALIADRPVNPLGAVHRVSHTAAQERARRLRTVMRRAAS